MKLLFIRNEVPHYYLSGIEAISKKNKCPAERAIRIFTKSEVFLIFSWGHAVKGIKKNESNPIFSKKLLMTIIGKKNQVAITKPEIVKFDFILKG